MSKNYPSPAAGHRKRAPLPGNVHDTRASEADMRRMTGSSVGADQGSPYSRHTAHSKVGDHRQAGQHTGRANKSEPPRKGR